MTKPRITISLPCYKRKHRTIRAIASILEQSINGWELLLTGDNCPEFKKVDFNRCMEELAIEADRKGNIIVCQNNDCHTGNYGFGIRNYHIARATAPYFIFMGSDDVLLNNHLENCLSYIEKTELDFVYFDTFVEPYNAPRNAQLKYGMIGHSELIIRTDFLRQMPPHSPHYGHDWELVQNMMNATDKYEKAIGAPQTYIVKSVKDNEEKGID